LTAIQDKGFLVFIVIIFFILVGIDIHYSNYYSSKGFGLLFVLTMEIFYTFSYSGFQSILLDHHFYLTYITGDSNPLLIKNLILYQVVVPKIYGVISINRIDWPANKK